MSGEQRYFSIRGLHVGAVGCPILVRVEQADPVKYLEKITAYKGL